MLRALCCLLAAVCLRAGGAASLELPLSVDTSQWLEFMRTDLAVDIDKNRLVANEKPTTIAPPQAPLTNEARQNRLIATLAVGDPPQKFNVAVDSNGSLAWIADESCDASGRCGSFCYENFCDLVCEPKCCSDDARAQAAAAATAAPTKCAASNRFNASKSSSYVHGNRDWVAQYEDSKIYGFTGSDTILLGTLNDANRPPLRLNAALFGQANEINGGVLTRDGQIDGVLGLNSDSAQFSGPQSLLQQAYKLRLVKRNEYTIYTDSDGVLGTLTLGERNKDRCQADERQIISNRHWHFEITSTQVDDQKEHKERWNASIALNEPTIVVPQFVLDEMVNATNAKYEEKYKAWFVDCDNTYFQWFFRANNGFYLTEENLIIEVAPSKCILAVGTPSTSQSSTEFVLGAPILSRYCVNFDVENYALFLGQKVG